VRINVTDMTDAIKQNGRQWSDGRDGHDTCDTTQSPTNAITPQMPTNAINATEAEAQPPNNSAGSIQEPEKPSCAWPGTFAHPSTIEE